MLVNMHLEYQVSFICLLIISLASENIEKSLSFRLHPVPFTVHSTNRLVDHAFGNLYLLEPLYGVMTKPCTVRALFWKGSFPLALGTNGLVDLALTSAGTAKVGVG